MEAIIIALIAGISIVFAIFDKMHSKHVIRIKDIFTSKYKYKTQDGTFVFSKGERAELAFLHQKWHDDLAWLKGILAFSLMFFWFFAYDGVDFFRNISSIMEILKSVLVWKMASTFVLSLTINWEADILLNMMRGQKPRDRGDKSGTDIIPFWGREIIIAASLAALILI